MIRKVNGHFADPKSTRDILGIKGPEYAIIITALQERYKSLVKDERSQGESDVEIRTIKKILSEINQPYQGAKY